MKAAFQSILISFLFILNGSWALSNQLPFSAGETITYDIKKFRLTVGEASLVFKGETEVKSQKALLIIFTVKALNFFDEEKIYVDPKTFYPRVVERNLDLWGKKEFITEEYDQRKGSIKIKKQSGGKTSEQMIQKAGPIDNIYGFIYRYRVSGQNKKGERFKIRLPTRDVEFQMVREERINAAKQEFTAYYMESVPKKNSVWFEKGIGRIPLKIDGAVNLAAASLVMKKYKRE